jgi:hypothetical protein
VIRPDDHDPEADFKRQRDPHRRPDLDKDPRLRM